MKDFREAVKDGFYHITHITDRLRLTQLREEGVRIDDEGYYCFSFGEHKEFELRIEPIGEEDKYYIALYKNDVLLTEKLTVWGVKKNM